MPRSAWPNGERDNAYEQQRAAGGEEQNEIIEGRAVGQRPGQAQVRSRHIRKAVVAAGQRSPAEGNSPHHLRQRQRDHQEVAASRAQRQQTEQRRSKRSEKQSGRQSKPQVPAQSQCEEPGGVCRNAEVSRVSQRGHAGITDQQIEAHREQGEDHHLDDQPEIIGWKECRAAPAASGRRRARLRRARHHMIKRFTGCVLIRVRTGRPVARRGSAPLARRW